LQRQIHMPSLHGGGGSTSIECAHHQQLRLFVASPRPADFLSRCASAAGRGRKKSACSRPRCMPWPKLRREPRPRRMERRTVAAAAAAAATNESSWAPRLFRTCCCTPTACVSALAVPIAYLLGRLRIYLTPADRERLSSASASAGAAVVPWQRHRSQNGRDRSSLVAAAVSRRERPRGARRSTIVIIVVIIVVVSIGAGSDRASFPGTASHDNLRVEYSGSSLCKRYVHYVHYALCHVASVAGASCWRGLTLATSLARLVSLRSLSAACAPPPPPVAVPGINVERVIRGVRGGNQLELSASLSLDPHDGQQQQQQQQQQWRTPP
jgi:hypothetical protein